MKTYKKIIARGIVVVGLTGLTGLIFLSGRKGNSNQECQIKEEPTPSHFASVLMDTYSGMSMTCGDFDGDGDLDLIVGALDPYRQVHDAPNGRLYLFNNDGKGNFSQKIYEKTKNKGEKMIRMNRKNNKEIGESYGIR